MAKQFLTMLDIANRRGTDKEIGLVQQIVNYAPEITTIMGRTIPGTFSTARVQVSIPKGGAFRAANSGSKLSAGTYERRRFNCFFFDAPLQVDEMDLLAAEQEGDSLGDLQADEVSGALMNKAIVFSQQFYNGADSNGYPGLLQLFQAFNGTDGQSQGVIDSRTGKALVNYIDAGGTSGATECVWYAWVHPQGVHFLFGGNSTVDVNPWSWQYVSDPTDSTKRFRASCSNIKGWIGLSCAHPFAIACIKNVDAAHGWTDALSAKLHALLPIGIKPNFCLASKRARGSLQQSRTVTLFGSAQAGKPADIPNVAPVPTVDIEGVPIIPTDGIQLTKAL
ncbi:MAG: hypothetical protein KGL39_44695 [Patescibacteria group bacterium]|nr:hypothetical protein [Patescibacteria group bacterium]